MERVVRVPNKNNGLLVLAGIQETQTCLGRKEGTGKGGASPEVPGGTRLSCTLQLCERPRPAVDEGTNVG